jgi:hypothetical protein
MQEDSWIWPFFSVNLNFRAHRIPQFGLPEVLPETVPENSVDRIAYDARE